MAKKTKKNPTMEAYVPDKQHRRYTNFILTPTWYGGEIRVKIDAQRIVERNMLVSANLTFILGGHGQYTVKTILALDTDQMRKLAIALETMAGQLDKFEKQ